MVLQDMGESISAALRKLNGAVVIDDTVVNEILKEIGNALLKADVNIRIAMEVKKNIKSHLDLENLPSGVNKRRAIRMAIFKELVLMLDPYYEENAPDTKNNNFNSAYGGLKRKNSIWSPRKGKTNVVMFVGLQGNGKTTTIGKYAYYYKQQGYKCCMVCADTFRAGAFDQLKQNATKVNVPFYGDYTEADPVKIAREGVETFRDSGKDLIIVDTSGRHKQEDALFEEMIELRSAVNPNHIIFVMDGTVGQGIRDQALAFSEAVDIGSVIVTKLDGHAKGGGALSAVAATNSPIAFIGTGERFDQLEKFEARGFVSRMLGWGDINGLVEKMKTIEPNKDMIKNIRKGQFTLRMLYDQLQTVQKLGNMSTIMSMIPGLSNMMKSGLGQAMMGDKDKTMDQFLIAMDSMTDDELDGIVQLTPQRLDRVSKGSGVASQTVGTIVMLQQQFAKMFAKGPLKDILAADSAGKMGGMSQQKMASMMQRNPKQMMQMMSKNISNPKMKAQMQSPQMQQMMRQMMNASGGDPSKLLSQLGGAGGLGGLGALGKMFGGQR